MILTQSIKEKKTVLRTTFILLGPCCSIGGSAIHRVNHYSLDRAIGFPNTYQLNRDSSDG